MGPPIFRENNFKELAQASFVFLVCVLGPFPAHDRCGWATQEERLRKAPAAGEKLRETAAKGSSWAARRTAAPRWRAHEGRPQVVGNRVGVASE